MTESNKIEESVGTESRVVLLCQEMEEATNLFLRKIAELEKLLPFVEE
jgi:hypothetical protein